MGRPRVGLQHGLDCVAAPGPAPATEWVLADKPHTSVLNPSPTDDYDLEAALALISEVAVAHGAAEDTASGRDRIAMRVMGALMPRPSEVATSSAGASTSVSATPRPTGSTACAATAATSAMRPSRATSRGRYPRSGATWRSRSTCPSRRRTRARSPPPVPPRTPARCTPPASCASRTRATRTLRRERQRPPRASEPAHRPHRAGRRALGVSIQPLCVLQRALHRHEHEPSPHAHRPRGRYLPARFCRCAPPLLHRLECRPAGCGRLHPLARPFPGRRTRVPHDEGSRPRGLSSPIDGYPDVEGAVLAGRYRSFACAATTAPSSSMPPSTSSTPGGPGPMSPWASSRAPTTAFRTTP